MKLGKPELLVLGAALALRLLLVQHATWWPISDSRDYHALARSLAEGRGYQQVYEGETTVYQGMVFRAYRMPGYPLALAAIYSVAGWEPAWAYLANVVFEMGTLCLVLWLGQRLFDRRTALVALALAALHVIWTPSLMTESLFTLLFTGLLAAALVDDDTEDRRPIGQGAVLGLGVLLAAAVFVRPIAVVALVPLLLRIRHAASGWRRWSLALALCVPLALTVGAWTARNARVVGAPVLLSTNFGAHNAEAFGVDHAEVVTQARARGLGEAGVDQRLRDEILGQVRSDPAAAVAVYFLRIVRLLTVEKAWETELLQELTFAGANGSPAVEVLYRALYGQYFFVYPLALFGLALLARAGRPGRIAWSLAAFAALHAAVSDSNIRFAAPLYPLLCLLASVGLQGIHQLGSYLQPRSSGASANDAGASSSAARSSTAASRESARVTVFNTSSIS